MSMTIREVIKTLISCDNLSSPVCVEILTRDENGSAQYRKIVSITHLRLDWFTNTKATHLVVEEEELRHTRSRSV